MTDAFPQRFRNSEANRHEICTGLKQYVKISSDNFTWICQISLHEINDDVQTWFLKNYVRRP